MLGNDWDYLPIPIISSMNWGRSSRPDLSSSRPDLSSSLVRNPLPLYSPSRPSRRQRFPALLQKLRLDHPEGALRVEGTPRRLVVAVEGLVEGELLIKGAIGLLRQGSTVLFTPNTPAPPAATLPSASGAAR